MKGGALVSKLVRQVNHDVIPNVGGDLGNWPLAVYANGRSVESTIWVRRDPGGGEIVGDSGGCCDAEQGGDRADTS
jgi:hypothetical protein